MKLYLLRHGETDWNTIYKLQGRTDIPLNENGREQAKLAAAELKDIPFDAVFSSPLSRAYETACIITADRPLTPVIDDRLTEMSFGKYEGTTPEYNDIYPNRVRLFADTENYVPDGGESFEDISKRCRNFLEMLKEKDYKNVLIVSHGALTKGILREINNTPLKDYWNCGVLLNCKAFEVDI